jgi:hypothetical protein
VPAASSGRAAKARRESHRESPWETRMKYALLWLLGVPIPVLIILYLLFR